MLALNTHKVTCYQQVRNGKRGGEGGEGGPFWTKNQIVTFQIFLFELRGIKSLPLQHPRSKESCMDRTNILMNHSFDRCNQYSLEFVIKYKVIFYIFNSLVFLETNYIKAELYYRKLSKQVVQLNVFKHPGK